MVMCAIFIICSVFCSLEIKGSLTLSFSVFVDISFLDHSMKFNVSTCHNIYLKSDYCLSHRAQRARDWDNRESLIYHCIILCLSRLPTDLIKSVILKSPQIPCDPSINSFILLLSVISKTLEIHMLQFGVHPVFNK